VTRFLRIWLPVWLSLTGLLRATDSLKVDVIQDNLTTRQSVVFHHAWNPAFWHINLQEIFRYQLFQQRHRRWSWDEYAIKNRFRLDLQRQYRQGWELLGQMSWNRFQDQRTGLNSFLRERYLLSGVGYRFAGWRSGALLGFQQETRQGITEYGPSIQLEMEGEQRRPHHYLWLSSRNRHTWFPIRRDYDYYQQLQYRWQSPQLAQWHNNLFWRMRRQDFYLDSIKTRQVRSIYELTWNSRFRYFLSSRFFVQHEVDWNRQESRASIQRTLDQDTLVEAQEPKKNLRLTNTSSLSYSAPSWETAAAFKLGTTLRRYYVDYFQHLYEMKLQLGWHPSGRRDSAGVSFLISRLQHDTPDTANNDDRDEWRSRTELTAVHYNPNWNYRILLRLNLFHLVYLFHQRSSDNHWNRVLTLRQELRWHRGKFRGQTLSEVQANYYAYDFDTLFVSRGEPRRSFVHRRLWGQQNFSWNLTPRWQLLAQLSLTAEEDGRLDWSTFIQEIAATNTIQQLNLSCKRITRTGSWQGGWTFQYRLRQRIQPEKEEYWQGTGPLLVWRIQLSGWDFNLRANYLQVKEPGSQYRIPQLFATLQKAL